ncbi:MAG: phosphopantetheine-binding protein [Dolichospermum sp.]|jgi:acyl carrier protein|nr:phosphopantetheine-binding protein [Anabaena sp. 49628_E55]
MKNRQEILEMLGEAMEINSAELTEETVLESLGDAWDSVAILSVISIIDSHAQKSIPVNLIVESKTIKDLIDLVYKNDNQAEYSRLA